MTFLRTFIIGSQLALVCSVSQREWALAPGRRQNGGSGPGGSVGLPGPQMTPRVRRTTSSWPTFLPTNSSGITDCEYEALVCMRAFKTGVLCARTAYYTYDTFKSACELQYVNCFYLYERWMVVHMGSCLGWRNFLVSYAGEDTYRDREDFLDNEYVVTDVQ